MSDYPLGRPSCEACRGACCETILLPETLQVDPEWFEARGGRIVPGALEIACVCPKLDTWGACSIYDERPRLCREYDLGGVHCRSAIRRLRTPLQQNAIFNSGSELSTVPLGVGDPRSEG